MPGSYEASASLARLSFFFFFAVEHNDWQNNTLGGEQGNWMDCLGVLGA